MSDRLGFLENQENQENQKESKKIAINNKFIQAKIDNISQEVDLNQTDIVYRSFLFLDKKIDLTPPKLCRQLAFYYKID